MNFLKKTPKVFCSVLLDGKRCKIFIRKMGSKKSVVSEEFDEFLLEEDENLQKLGKIAKDQSYISIMHTSANQGIEFKKDSINTDEYAFEEVDKKVFCYMDKTKIDDFAKSNNFVVNEYMSAFKILYFLSKNQNFKGTSLFVLRFNESAAFMIANEDRVFVTKMVEIYDEILNYLESDSNLSDIDEFFCNILENFIKQFYENSNEFINEIYIYDEKSSEVGYYIFTKIFIKTQIVPLNIVDFMNKINLKEKLK
ncbi:hypothetical protein F1B92_00250 [Campylobacter sp. FMV-PI01]|uniref:DUF3822 family protein n=1 Tax=Campylobacter portucalensis TaxID=2608384 RepID=A0A6L5WGZ9_9BACT|nr:hypothetical protein [Campylobacter portucalensis]MSN95642.1 hypothetical protein [Campylobacter portucalensis]